MSPSRSAVLGFNHNIRYRGVTFHVQTEDAGSDAAHIDTHLFREGLILATRKDAYSPDASEESVYALMKAQHVAVLRDLKAGAFDDKITETVGELPPLPATPPPRPEVPKRGRPTPAVGLVVVRPAVTVGTAPAAPTPASERSLDDVLRALLGEDEKPPTP